MVVYYNIFCMTSFIFQIFHPGSISVISSLRGQCRAMNQFCLAHTDLDLVYEYGKEKFATFEALSVVQWNTGIGIWNTDSQ